MRLFEYQYIPITSIKICIFKKQKDYANNNMICNHDNISFHKIKLRQMTSDYILKIPIQKPPYY